jgi:hypothetical protein
VATVPARLFVDVIPSVVAPAAAALETIGIMICRNRRVPLGGFMSFPGASQVQSFFGAGTSEANLAPYYFDGFVGASASPAALLVAQFPVTGAPAWLQGGSIAGLTIPQLQGITGTLSVVVDGYTYTSASVNLSGDTSFSAAAATLQTELNTTLPAGASVTGSIAAVSGTFTGSINGNILTVTSIPTYVIVPGSVLTGAGVTALTEVVNQLSGTAGGIGTYAVSLTQVVASETITCAYGIMTVTVVGSGTISIGQTLSGGSVTAGTQVTALGTGVGLTGTYYVNPSQTATSEAITATGSALAITYDSVSGGLVVTSGQVGPAAVSSTMAFFTGTASAALNLTQATGATISQGGVPQTPGAFMTALANLTQNWFSFFTTFDPDDALGAVGVNTQKMAFAAWTSQQLDDPFCYICEDTDISPSTTVPANSSMGQLLPAGNLSGTCLIWNPNGATTINANPFGSRAAFISGSCASVDFNETNGRITAAFKSSQAGLIPDVTSLSVAVNLAGNPQNAGNGTPTGGNNYNWYGAVATAAQSFTFFSPGSISGPFLWLDGYLDQAWLDANFQLAILVLLTQIKSFPYNAAGYALLSEALTPTILQALDFGAIRPNIPLSATQALEVNQAAGIKIDQILSTRGWYLQVKNATAAVRAARGSPPARFFYTDGGCIQSFALHSVDVL